ncbi:hypothetical protein [Limimaricola soesokkakensis]|uniref:hypothetical protein n=1 Tax=Limimaricola soesokkakensis TaxID=1343159 RepID=UPI0035157A49
MTDNNHLHGSGRTQLRSRATMPRHVAAPPAAAPVWEDADSAMKQLDVEQMGRLEKANTDLLLERLSIDPAHLDLRPLIRFWSHVCISHGELISEVVGHGISNRTIVVALQEAQDEAELCPCMDEIAAASPDLAARLRAAMRDPDMTRIWSPDELEGRARDFRMSDLASKLDSLDGEDVLALSSVLAELDDHCTASGTTLRDYLDIDLDDLPQAALLAAGIDVAVSGRDCGSGVERRAP